MIKLLSQLLTKYIVPWIIFLTKTEGKLNNIERIERVSSLMNPVELIDDEYEETFIESKGEGESDDELADELEDELEELR